MSLMSKVRSSKTYADILPGLGDVGQVLLCNAPDKRGVGRTVHSISWKS